MKDTLPSNAIAIVGMACRFPGANNLTEFWHNLVNNKESTTRFSPEELLAAGIDPQLINDPRYVPVKGKVQGYDLFDAAFFGYTPREAEMMDPQHRLFLMSCWHALEDAGHTGLNEEQRTGVFAGIGMPTYILRNIMSHPELTGSDMDYQLLIGNDKDFAPTRVSYKLNLTGPSFNINTACSSSLVAVHLACHSLLDYQCDLALAGAASIRVPQEEGYLYQQSGIPSPDGKCRAFDSDAQGTVGGSGVGVVLLRRLEDALQDHDSIYAIIRASAINNDGSDKVGFTAPSINGQARLIAEAQSLAEIPADSISYIEAHGTATPLGDPIEMAALTQAFRLGTQRCGYCAVGSVKTNVGHLDTAAGMAGLIKTALALKNKQIPASLHFNKPNPKLNIEKTPFYINAELQDWQAPYPRRAGVSSFGVGGTNAHVILQEAPTQEWQPTSHRKHHLLLLSAKNTSALTAQTKQLTAYLATRETPLADVAYTLACGRRPMEYRYSVVTSTIESAISQLTQPVKHIQPTPSTPPRTAFLFPGQGSQHRAMAWGIYQQEPIFRREVDACANLLEPILKCDIRQLLNDTSEQAEQRLQSTAIAQPMIFTISYALARLWESWGVTVSAMLGHSLGEYVAACLAGVFSRHDALHLIAQRGALMQAMPSGAMTAVPLSEHNLLNWLNPELSIAAVNTPECCTVSGHTNAITALEQALKAQSIDCKRLRTSHAFHSPLMEPVQLELQDLLENIPLSAPMLPVISNLTGGWLTAEQATSPSYWGQQMASPVRFADGIDTLKQHSIDLCLEVGPGHSLSSLIKFSGWQTHVLQSLPQAQQNLSQPQHLLKVLGQLWCHGVNVNWSVVYSYENNQRIHLPGYPFQQNRYWIEPLAASKMLDSKPATINTDPQRPLEEWFYTPGWQRLAASPERPLTGNWLLFIDHPQMAKGIIAALQLNQCQVIQVCSNHQYYQENNHLFFIRPDHKADYQTLFSTLKENNQQPQHIIHAWSVGLTNQNSSYLLSYGYYSLIYVLQTATEYFSNPLQVTAISATAQAVTGKEHLTPEMTALLGPIQVAPLEYPQLSCSYIDMELPENDKQWPSLLKHILQTSLDPQHPLTAVRGNYRWIPNFTPLPISQPPAKQVLPRRTNGTYLITGGLGGISLQLAECLARNTDDVNLVLCSRQAIETPKTSVETTTISSSIDWPWLQQQEAQLHAEYNIKSIDHHPGLRRDLLQLCHVHLAHFLDKQFDHITIQAKFNKFVEWMLSVLTDQGIIQMTDENIQWLDKSVLQATPQTLAADIQKNYPGFAPLVKFLTHCVKHYPSALSGEIEAISVLYPEGQADLLKRSVADTVEHTHHRIYGHLLRELLAKLLNTPRQKPLRIIEIGAGTGILTRWLLPALKNHDIEYWFTDIGRSFVMQAQADFSHIDGMHFTTYDVTLDPVEQGFALHSFDLVLELDAIHATANLENTLNNIRKLLVAGGQLCLVESTQTECWTNMAYGLADGWWYFEDELRSDSPLLKLPQWKTLLEHTGYQNVHTFPDTATSATINSGLIIAQQTDQAIYHESYTAIQGNPEEVKQQRLHKLQQLNALGANIMQIQADVANREQLAQAVQQAQDKFGPIHGVIHNAATENRGPIALKTANIADSEFAAKVYGTRHLAELFSKQPLDFFILSSSISAIAPGPGDAEYGASNACIDSFAKLLNQQGIPALSINWERWRQVGMAVSFEARHQQQTGKSPDGGMSAQQGADAFMRMLSRMETEQIIMSRLPINNMIKQARALDIEHMQKAEATPVQSHSRPCLETNFQAPANELEQTITTIWQDVLGVQPIGRHDSFHEIGGDSLIAIKVVSRLRESFSQNVTVQTLFETPTIAGLAIHFHAVQATVTADENETFDEGVL